MMHGQQNVKNRNSTLLKQGSVKGHAWIVEPNEQDFLLSWQQGADRREIGSPH